MPVSQTGCAGSVGAWPVAAPAALRVLQVRCDRGVAVRCAIHLAPRRPTLTNLAIRATRTRSDALAGLWPGTTKMFFKLYRPAAPRPHIA
jgi:hypothetical protein